MSKPVVCLIAAVVGLSVLCSAGPTLVGLIHAAVPFVLALGSVIVVLRLVWYFTRRY